MRYMGVSQLQTAEIIALLVCHTQMCVICVLTRLKLKADLMLEGATDQLGKGMQEGPLAKARSRAALNPLGEHGGLPRGPVHASPCLAHPACLLADDAHAAVPVSLHTHHTCHTLTSTHAQCTACVADSTRRTAQYR